MRKLSNSIAALALTVVGIGVTAPQKVEAASFLHEFPDRAILEARCTRTGNQSLAVVQLTQQFGGSINRLSVVVTAPGQMRSPLLERDLKRDESARAGHIFLGSPPNATFTGAFWGISGSGNPIRYSIPEDMTVTCD